MESWLEYPPKPYSSAVHGFQFTTDPYYSFLMATMVSHLYVESSFNLDCYLILQNFSVRKKEKMIDQHGFLIYFESSFSISFLKILHKLQIS